MSAEITQAGGALAIRPDQTDWTPAQQAVLQQSGIDNQVTGAELSAFLHLCQRTRLDPFSRQIYLIGRWDNRQQRKVYTPQTSIDGYRVIAHRVVAEQNANLGYEDTLWCDQDGRWRDVWLSDAPPSGVKVTVIRNGQRFPAVALFREYVQTGKGDKPIGLWGKMPAGQLAKCAEALALRKAFPHDLAGVYTAEEMAQADNPAVDERHLRTVQPGESDPWATAAPAPQTAAQGRDYLHEANGATDADTVRRIYREAANDGAVPEYLAQIAEVGKQKAAAEKQDDGVVDAEVVETGASPHSMSDAVAAEPTVTTEADVAERDLRAAAAQAGLTNLDEEFERSYGLPIREAGAQQMREMTGLLTGTAA
ncbi:MULTISPECIES: phage recombination protein Bet [Streptomyces]|uniref:phage recombination protein Bet n=1 Tax=Streptomyces scabiei TaxID=1930 RepID=UPI001B321CEB|nr:phage recombination protein Bet [Streptomyces sp. LBUM 1486]